MSKIFTNAEIKEIEKRKNKDYSDKQGLFAGRIKPKIRELINIWFPKKKELKKLLENKKSKKPKGNLNEMV